MCLLKKSKGRGIISGHDYTMSDFIKDYRCAVIAAVYPCCVAFGWEFIFMTVDVTEKQSFTIREIK